MLLPYDEAGHGRPVVLLHARPADRTMWAVHLPLLAAAGVRAVALDLPGHGEAAVPTDGRLSAPWSDVLETLDRLGQERFVLAGNSLGALVALQAAVTAPERVEGLVLIGYRPHDLPASPRLQAAWDDERAALAADDLEAAIRAGVEAWTSPEASREIREHAARMLRTQLTSRHGEPAEAPDPLGDKAVALHGLNVPALVGVGELDMPDFFEGGRKLAEILGTGDIVTIPAAGHLAPLEQPAAFCALLLDFVRGLPEHQTKA
jgi:pimeloyl-ACP methyl ester carboxylesterase